MKNNRKYDIILKIIVRGKNMKIRNMSISDYEQVFSLWSNTKGMGLRSLDDSKEGIERFLLRNPKTNFVGEKDGKIYGAVISGHDGRRGYIYHMCVDNKIRNQGIGTQLLQHCLQALKDEGIMKIALVVFADNEIGNHFWEKHGFMLREDLYYRNISLILENQ